MTSPLIWLGLYTAFLAVLLLGFWVYGIVADRLHARRTVAAFDAFVRNLNNRRGTE